MHKHNGFSELAKLMFKHSGNTEKLKHLLIAQYPTETLLRYLQSEDQLVTRAAAAALKLIGDEEAVPALIDALKDNDIGTRLTAESALWHIWTRSGDASIDKMLNDGKSLLKAEAYEEAVEHFTEVIKAAPVFAEGYNQRAIAYFLMEEWSKSIRDCKRAIALNPNHFGAFAGMGHVYVRLGKIEEAIEAYKKALLINPNLIGIAETVLRLRGDY